MKHFRFLFDKGITVVQDKAILGDGWSTVLDNVDLRSGMPKPVNGPVFVKSVTTGLNRIFNYRGKFHTSALYRDYVAEFVDGIERIYYTEYGSNARKIISGTDVILGTIAPKAAPTVTTTKQLVPGTVTLTQSTGGSLPSGVRSYRVAAETSDGIMSPSGKVTINIAVDNSQVFISWSTVLGAVWYHIFGGVEDDEREIKKVPATSATWTDTGAYPPSGDYASSYITTNPYTYIYTFVRDVNSVQDESGPSDPSYPITTTYGRRVAFDILNDGYFGQDEVVSVTGGISYTPSGYDPIGISGYVFNSALQQVKFTTRQPHGLNTFDKAYFANLYDYVWNGTTQTVIADSTDTSVFYVKNMPAPNPSSSPTTLTGSYFGWGSVSYGTIYEILVVGPSGTPWGDYGATGITGSFFKSLTSALLPLGSSVSQVAAFYPAKTTIDIGVTGPTNGDCIYAVYNGSGTTYRASGVTGTSLEIGLLSATGGTVSEVRYIPNNNYFKYRNVYRTGDAGGYFLVKQVDICEPYVDDGLSVTNLGGPPDSYYTQNGVTVIYDVPPSGMSGMETHYGMLFAIDGYKVRWTPIGRQDAWPSDFCYQFPFKPIALASFAQSLIVLCEDSLYRIDGNVPTGMSISKTLAEDGCIAPHTVQKTHAGLVYVSKRGVMLFDGNSSRCITDRRINSRFLLGPSALETNIDYWWHPTLWGYNYANLCMNDGISTKVVNAYPLENTFPISGIQNNLRSFFSLGKYYLFWSTSGNYEANTCLCIDLQVEDFPITTLGMKVVDACVNETEQVFVLTPNFVTPPPALSWNCPSTVSAYRNIDKHVYITVTGENNPSLTWSVSSLTFDGTSGEGSAVISIESMPDYISDVGNLYNTSHILSVTGGTGYPVYSLDLYTLVDNSTDMSTFTLDVEVTDGYSTLQQDVVYSVTEMPS